MARLALLALLIATGCEREIKSCEAARDRLLEDLQRDRARVDPNDVKARVRLDTDLEKMKLHFVDACRKVPRPDFACFSDPPFRSKDPARFAACDQKMGAILVEVRSR